VNPSAIQVFSSMNLFKKDHETQKGFLERCDVIYNQGIFTLRTIESIWLHRLAYKSCSQMIFPSLNFFVGKKVVYSGAKDLG
jgi:preprotein translocase subunit SecB